MYNDNTGTMFEYKDSRKKNNGGKIVKRLIVVSILLLIVFYLILILIDYNRSKNNEDPLITLSKETINYNDGTVEIKNSIGYKFIKYNRSMIKTTELVPFYQGIKYKDIQGTTSTTYPVLDNDYPTLDNNYEVLDNPDHLPKQENILYFYEDDNLISTYKCIYNDACSINYLLDKQYAFINEINEDKNIVYLLDLSTKVIIGEYEEVKVIEELDKTFAAKQEKYGVNKIENNRIINIINYNNDAVTYLSNSKVYMLTNENKYRFYNPIDNITSEEIDSQIYKVEKINNNYYMYTKENKVLHMYDISGNKITKEEEITYIKPYDKFIIYIKRGLIHIADYNGNVLNKETIPVYFNKYETEGVNAFYITISGNTLIISTPMTEEKTHYTKEYYYDLTTFELTKKRDNVKETIE